MIIGRHASKVASPDDARRRPPPPADEDAPPPPSSLAGGSAKASAGERCGERAAAAAAAAAGERLDGERAGPAYGEFGIVSETRSRLSPAPACWSARSRKETRCAAHSAGEWRRSESVRK